MEAGEFGWQHLRCGGHGGKRSSLWSASSQSWIECLSQDSFCRLAGERNPCRGSGREAAITPNKNRRFCDSHVQKPVSELCEVVSSAKQHRILGCQWSASVQSHGFTAASNANRHPHSYIPVTNTPCLLGVIAASLLLAPFS